jgi:hypothetical protein
MQGAERKAKITKLSDEQWAEILAYRDEALRKALTPGPADIEAARLAFDKMCDAVGEKRRPIFRFSSPLIAILAMPFVISALTQQQLPTVAERQLDSQLRSQLGSQLGSQLDSQLYSQLRSQLGSQLRSQLDSQLGSQLRSQLDSQLGSQLYSQLDSQLRSQLRSQLGSQLRSQLDSQLGSQLDSQLYSQLRSQLGSQLYSQLDSQLRSQLRSQLGSQLRSQLDSQLGSQLDSQLRSQLDSQLDSKLGSQLDNATYYRRYGHCEMGWWAYWRGGEMAGAFYSHAERERLGWWLTVSETCGWWWPMESCIIVAGRPETRWDDQRLLHCENGPAIDFDDGCEVYSWHGVQVPKEWITEKAITPQQALTWENIEQRRAACEILGWNRIISELGGITIDRDDDPQVGELIRVAIPEIGEEKFLRVRCGTGREFALPVPPNMKTALEANAWTYGIDGNALRGLEVRT